MHFIKTSSPAVGEVDLTEYLRKALFAERRVLWLVSGGSNIPTTITVMQQLGNAPLKNLTIMLCDERYGQVDHADSNAYQLLNAGLDIKEATFIPVLDNMSLSETVDHFAKSFQKAASKADVIIGQFGLGSDGHIAGILPGSEAVTSNSPVESYQGSGFTRITLTFKSLELVKTAYVFAWGDSKKQALQTLQSEDLPLSSQPAQFLKQLPEVYVYNDQIGDLNENSN